VFTIGIDPHKGSHTATVLDRDERQLAELRVVAGRDQGKQLLSFAAEFTPRTWAVECASGLGALLAQQLVAAGETVLDVPAPLSARARLLDSGNTDKTDSHDARSAALVAIRHRQLRPVTKTDHTAVLRVLSDRHRNLVAARTRTMCRLHALICLMVAGGLPAKISTRRAAEALSKIRPGNDVDVERKHVARDLLGDIRRLDAQILDIKARITTAVEHADSTVVDIYGVGPIVAAIILGHTGDVTRFPTAGHYARYNGTAPIEASSGPRVRHRLNRRGNRTLNHAVHLIALTQIAHDTPGRDYYQRRIDQGRTPKEAIRSLKRHISNAVYRALTADLDH
jgi:transposase